MPGLLNTVLTAVVLIALLAVLLPTAVLLVRLVMRPDQRLNKVERELVEVQEQLEAMRLELRSATETLRRTENTLNAFVQRAIERST